MRFGPAQGAPVSIAVALALAVSGCAAPRDLQLGEGASVEPPAPAVEARSKPILFVGGARFRDLDADGALTPYEDWRRSSRERARDLVARMTLEEKVGTLLHASLRAAGASFDTSGDAYDLEQVRDLVDRAKISSFVTRLVADPAKFAQQNNAVQEIGEASRLGIPITISSDPRNHFQYVPGATNVGGGFSQWPEPLGFAALGDPGVVRDFADRARREYRAVGIHMTLSPQADLATEPRWPRQSGTFGADAARVSEMVGAYVSGFQGGSRGVTRDGVIAVVKHWAGYGAQPEGFDGHNYYGRFADLPGDSLETHVAAFDGAFAARVAGVMPAYPVLRDARIAGEALEPVAPGFSAQMIRQRLRTGAAFDGIVLSDWLVTKDCGEWCRAPTAEHPQSIADVATPWGVEQLSEKARFAKALDAGVDQFGGIEDPEPLLAAVRDGLVSEARIDRSVERLLRSKFDLGLFDDPYVDPVEAAAILEDSDTQARAQAVQARSQVLLQNRSGLLPIAAPAGRTVWLFNFDADVARAAGLNVTEDPAAADFAIIRAEAPFETLHPYHFFGSRQHEGRLDYRRGDTAYDALLRAHRAGLPTVFAVFLDRPAILRDVAERADVILGNFGASDQALLAAIAGKTKPQGHLPFELPSSMQAVEAQSPALPDDSVSPLYPRGFGLVE